MKFQVEIEFDKVEYDSGRGNRYLILEWLIDNYGSGMGNEPNWISNFDYERSKPWKLLKVYSFKNSQDAMFFKLKWA